MGNSEETTMPTAKHIHPDTKIGLKLTATERKLILNDLICLDDDYAKVIGDTPADQPVQFTLEDWDDLGGYIAAEANHAEDKKTGKILDAIFNKVQEILDTFTDGTRSSWSGADRSIPKRSMPRPQQRKCGEACRTGGRWNRSEGATQ
jgi:hypothetical protein